jgi:hypothetical protein
MNESHGLFEVKKGIDHSGDDEFSDVDTLGCECADSLDEALRIGEGFFEQGYDAALYVHGQFEGDWQEDGFHPDMVIESDGRVHPFLDYVANTGAYYHG